MSRELSRELPQVDSVLTHQHHEEEKNYILTWQAVGVGTTFYDGDSAVQSEVQVADEREDEDHHDAVSYSNDGIIFPLEETHSSDNSESCPVLFLYDCEAAGGISI